MGLRFQKRVGGNDGMGLNISGLGLSSSYRSKYGAIGSKGFSIRSGIPGLSFRSGWGGGKNKGAGALIILLVIVALFAFYYAAVIVYNLAILLWWVLTEFIHYCLRVYYKWKDKQELKQTVI